MEEGKQTKKMEGNWEENQNSAVLAQEVKVEGQKWSDL